jgi:outer membrane immunogenic protein
MKRLATAITTITLIGTPAFAAPPSPPAPVYNWTGWYAGVNAGAGFGGAKTDFNVSPVFAGLGTVTGGFAGSDTESPDGFIGGGQIGYNWQVSPIWVAGLEADFQGAVERDGANLNDPFNFTVPGGVAQVTGTQVTNYTTKIDWFGTVRGRIGYVWGNGNVMSYLTGGLAYGKVDLEGTNTVSGSVIGTNATFSVTQALGHSQINTGWVLGYGTEGVIDFWGARNWTWKIESLYMDLGHLDVAGMPAGFSTTNFNPAIASGAQVTTHSHFTDGILRAGLNYKFY